MDDTIKLLEDRVKTVAGRLRDTNAERRRLEAELRTLRDQVARSRPEDAGASDSEREVWQSRKTQALEAIREIIADLRG
jgi:hypothetical protein